MLRPDPSGYDAFKFSEFAERIYQNNRVNILNDPSLAEVASHKDVTSRILPDMMPNTQLVYDKKEAEKAIHKIFKQAPENNEYKMFLKPVSGGGARGTMRFKTKKSALEALKKGKIKKVLGCGIWKLDRKNPTLSFLFVSILRVKEFVDLNYFSRNELIENARKTQDRKFRRHN